MVTGILFQVADGFPHIELEFYLVPLFVGAGVTILMFGMLSFFVQTVVNHKFVGLLIVLLVVAGLFAVDQLGYGDLLILFAGRTPILLSDMNGFGHFVPGSLWFAGYWALFCVLLGLAANGLWPRGTAGTLLHRVRLARHAISPPAATLAAISLTAMVATGGYIFLNTHIRNPHLSAADIEKRSVDFERMFGDSLTLPQPRVSAVDVAVDLYPESRAFSSRGSYVLINRDKVPIGKVHVQFDYDVEVNNVELAGADLIDAQRRFNHFVFESRTPIAPSESRKLTFSLSKKNPGFKGEKDISSVVHNGTFVRDRELAPTIGIARSRFLSPDHRRKAYGLQPSGDLAGPDDWTLRRRNYIRDDSDFVSFTVTV
jgi:hypothetical protein